MAANNFDLKGFLNDPKVQADKAGAVKYLQSKGIIDATGNVVSSASTTTSSPTSTFVGSLPVIKQATEYGIGIGTGTAKIGLNIGESLLKAGKFLGTKIFGADPSISNKLIGGIEDIKTKMYEDPFKKELASKSGKAGTITANVLPYLETAGAISGTTNAVAGAAGRTGEIVSDLTGVGAKTLPALSRILGGATTEAAQNYVLGYALSGGDKNQAKWQALISGGLKGVTGAIGEFLKGAKVDTKLMSAIYGDTKSEAASSLRYGTPTKGLAQEALDRGIVGDTRQQAVQIQKGLNDSENALMKEFEAAGNPPIPLDNPQRYITAVNNRADLLEKAGATTEAQGLRSSVSAIRPDGTIPANNALALRRFLDALRMDKSYLTQTEELGAQQAGLKEMTDALRSQINSVGESSGIMKDYQFYTKAMNKLVDFAYKQDKKPVIDFFTGLLGAESLLQHSPAGLLMAVGRKAVGAAPATTAQFVKNLPTSSVGGTAARAITGAGVSNLVPTQGNQSTLPTTPQ